MNHHQNWFLNHAPKTGDSKVFLFGFSRGALIMRVFAEWLCQRGIPVEYMGLWDTVDSTVGIKGEDYIELPTNVKFARHAVARDEQRRFFGYLPLKPYRPRPRGQALANESVFAAPVVSYTPELTEAEKAKRVYRTYGKVRLGDNDWTIVPDGQEGDFFKVAVELK